MTDATANRATANRATADRATADRPTVNRSSVASPTAKAAVGRSTSLTERTVATAREALNGHGGVGAVFAFIGPAVVASIAYMDPGNFATNIQAGAKYGYELLWVVLVANVVAMLFQGLSAKLGIVTGKNLAEHCRDHFPRRSSARCGCVSEIAAMATDLAEFLGGAIGLSLLLHMPLAAGMVVTAIVTYGLLMCEKFGFRPLELIIGSIVGVICLCYLVEMFIAPVDWASAAFHTVTPQIPDAEALLLCRRHHRRHGDAARDLSTFRVSPRRACRVATTTTAARSCDSRIGKSLSRCPSPAWSTWPC